MFAFLQSLGSSPESTDFWKMAVSAGDISEAHSCKTRFGNPSGPAALLILIFCSNLVTPFLLIVRGGMCSFTRVGKGGILSPSSFVKTDWNWSINFSAFPLPSVTKRFPDFRGETPILSSFLDFKKGFEFLCFRPSLILLFMYDHSGLRSSRLLSR